MNLVAAMNIFEHIILVYLSNEKNSISDLRGSGRSDPSTTIIDEY